MRFPRQLVPLSVVATEVVAFAAMTAIVLALALWFRPESRDLAWLAVPLAAVIVVFVAGLALAAAALNAIFRDVEFVVTAALLPWFFLTPMLYRLEDLPGADERPWLIDLLHWGNPVTPAVEAYRAPLYAGELPPSGTRSTSASRPSSRSRSGQSSSARSTTGSPRKRDDRAALEEAVVPEVGGEPEVARRLAPPTSEGRTSGRSKRGLRPAGAHGRSDARRAVARAGRRAGRRPGRPSANPRRVRRAGAATSPVPGPRPRRGARSPRLVLDERLLLGGERGGRPLVRTAVDDDPEPPLVDERQHVDLDLVGATPTSESQKRFSSTRSNERT